eukprot:1177559-Prorocentrum_minimum.AAC.4
MATLSPQNQHHQGRSGTLKHTPPPGLPDVSGYIEQALHAAKNGIVSTKTTGSTSPQPVQPTTPARVHRSIINVDPLNKKNSLPDVKLVKKEKARGELTNSELRPVLTSNRSGATDGLRNSGTQGEMSGLALTAARKIDNAHLARGMRSQERRAGLPVRVL